MHGYSTHTHSHVHVHTQRHAHVQTYTHIHSDYTCTYTHLMLQYKWNVHKLCMYICILLTNKCTYNSVPYTNTYTNTYTCTYTYNVYVHTKNTHTFLIAINNFHCLRHLNQFSHNNKELIIFTKMSISVLKKSEDAIVALLGSCR